LDYAVDPIIERDISTIEKQVKELGLTLPDGRVRTTGTAWLRVNSPGGLVDIDRLAALSKFYRSLVVVFLLLAAFGYPARSPNSSPEGVVWIWPWVSLWWPAASLVVAALAILAYGFYRSRHRKTVVLYLTIAAPNARRPVISSVD
jgi:hypothetical protein